MVKVDIISRRIRSEKLYDSYRHTYSWLAIITTDQVKWPISGVITTRDHTHKDATLDAMTTVVGNLARRKQGHLPIIVKAYPEFHKFWMDSIKKGIRTPEQISGIRTEAVGKHYSIRVLPAYPSRSLSRQLSENIRQLVTK